MRPVPRIVVLLGALALPAGAVGSCASESSGQSDAVAITATDSACEVATTSLPAGTLTFAIANEGEEVTEVYVYEPDDSVVAERENIGPGEDADLTVELTAGTYEIACKPGMEGDGIRQKITVSGKVDASADHRLDQAVTRYRAYVEQQVAGSLTGTRKLAAAVKDGDVAEAKRLYAPSRVGWERIEPVAESFGDIDPKVDIREPDLEPGQEFTGWHRIEKALWVKGSTEGMGGYADRLVADLEELSRRVPAAKITPTSMANGAKELLDEVATTKITGEEEAFSHTDLVDFQANVEGAKKAHQLLRPVVNERDAELARTLDREFADVLRLLDGYREDDGFVSYDTVEKAQRRELSDAVNALAEPLSKLAAAVAR